MHCDSGIFPISKGQTAGLERIHRDPNRSIFPLFKGVPAAERRLRPTAQSFVPLVFQRPIKKNGATSDHVPSPVCYIRMVPLLVASFESVAGGPLNPTREHGGS